MIYKKSEKTRSFVTALQTEEHWIELKILQFTVCISISEEKVVIVLSTLVCTIYKYAKKQEWNDFGCSKESFVSQAVPSLYLSSHSTPVSLQFHSGTAHTTGMNLFETECPGIVKKYVFNGGFTTFV